MQRLGLLCGLLALTTSGGLFAAGCGKTDSAVGAVHPVASAPCDSPGARAPAGDGCNECTCQSGLWACSSIPCTARCTPGAMKPAADRCNTCACTSDGSWACTEEACTAECSPGELRLAGACRTCTCLEPGSWSCTDKDCACLPGEQMLAFDGCNTCTCGDDDGWACTETGCNRCPLPRNQVECDASPVYAKNPNGGACCYYSCPPDAPLGWALYTTYAECDGCPSGFADCDAEPTNGCEQNLLTSPAHCGACGLTCSLQNATATCRNASCLIDTCDAGFADCDGLAANGCETSLENDAANCGACALTCTSVHGSAECNTGQCTIVCDAGYADCNGDPADGCEVDVSVDVNNCGQCGQLCAGPGATCVQGSCGVD